VCRGTVCPTQPITTVYYSPRCAVGFGGSPRRLLRRGAFEGFAEFGPRIRIADCAGVAFGAFHAIWGLWGERAVSRASQVRGSGFEAVTRSPGSFRWHHLRLWLSNNAGVVFTESTRAGLRGHGVESGTSDVGLAAATGVVAGVLTAAAGNRLRPRPRGARMIFSWTAS